jgi:hypothetical protein
MTTSDMLIQTLLLTLIQVLVPVFLGFAIVWVKGQIEAGKAKLSKEQLDMMTSLAQKFVLAAEQNGLTGAIKDEAAAKKEWALLRLESEMDQRGIHMDVRLLSDAIESAVHEAFKMS